MVIGSIPLQFRPVFPLEAPETAGGDSPLGQPLRRREDERLVRGAGRFVDDLAPPGVLHAVFVRAPQAGRIVGISADCARGSMGVRAVLTAGDLPMVGRAAVNPLLDLGALPPFEPLARAEVVAGEAVAMVIGATALVADDAAAEIVVDYAAADERTPSGFSGRWGDQMAPDGAVHSVDIRIRHALLAPMALEPRATLAVPEGDGISVFLSTQTPYRARDDIAALLGWPKTRVRVVAPDVGGAFGGKASLTPEDAAVVLAAVRLDAPVKWRASRSEEFLAATRGRGAETHGRLHLAADGAPVALEASGAFPAGHWWPYSVAAPARNFGRILPGPYRVPASCATVTASAAPTAAVNIYRGAGRPEATMLMERLIDRAAAESGADPLDYRLRHLIGSDEMANAPGTGKFDASHLPSLLKLAAREAGYAKLRRAQARRRRKGEIVGIGLATYIEPCGQGHEWARVGVTPEGRVLAFTGSSAQGQGRETAMAQIVGDVLGIAAERIDVREGDTGDDGNGIGALASRSTAIGGSAMLLAARSLKRRLAGRTPTEFAAENAARPDVHGLILGVEKTFVAPDEAWASGAVVAAVSICAETGRLSIERLVWADDAGVVVNPMLVEGQLHGGLAQGFGEAVMERLLSDGDGQLLTGSLMDYAVPRAADVPSVTLIKRSTRSVMNPLGAKGVGEAGCIGIPAALVNAACDALAPSGVTHLDMPLTSETLWRAMNRKEP